MATTPAHPSAQAASTLVGRNVRKLRADHTAEQLARECTVWGLRWGTARVAELEAGKVAATVGTIHKLCMALTDLLGRPVAPTELFAGDPVLQSVVSNQAVRRPRPDPIAQQQRAFIERVWATWPDRLQKRNGRNIHKVKAAMVEADIRVGASLGLDADRTAAEMEFAWGRPLSVERDERAGPGANKQRRGQHTRVLKEQLRKQISDGDG